jgi:hypothetical protein
MGKQLIILLKRIIEYKMEIKSLKHFEKMKMMCEYFKKHSLENDLYIPEYEAAKEINSIIENESNTETGIAKIKSVLERVEKLEHMDNVQWYDYKLHLNPFLFLDKH